MFHVPADSGLLSCKGGGVVFKFPAIAHLSQVASGAPPCVLLGNPCDERCGKEFIVVVSVMECLRQ